MKTQRYTIYSCGCGGVKPDEVGVWCHYEDTEKLEQENECMRTELKNIRRNLIFPISSVKERMKMSENISKALGEE